MRLKTEAAWWIIVLTVIVGMFGAVGAKNDPMGFLLGPASPLLIEIGFGVVGVVYVIWGVLILIGRGWEPQQILRSDPAEPADVAQPTVVLPVQPDAQRPDSPPTAPLPYPPVIPIRRDKSA